MRCCNQDIAYTSVVQTYLFEPVKRDHIWPSCSLNTGSSNSTQALYAAITSSACSHNTPDNASIPRLASVDVMESANWTSGPARILATTTSNFPAISSGLPHTSRFLATLLS